MERIRPRDGEARDKLLVLVSLAYALLIEMPGGGAGALPAQTVRSLQRGHRATEGRRSLHRLGATFAAIRTRFPPNLRVSH